MSATSKRLAIGTIGEASCGIGWGSLTRYGGHVQEQRNLDESLAQDCPQLRTSFRACLRLDRRS